MDAREFARGYPREIIPAASEQAAAPAVMWSHRFGTLLHDCLSGAPLDRTATEKEVKKYLSWANTGTLALYMTHVTAPTVDFKVRDNASFHVLNAAMIPMWRPLLHGKWNDNERTTMLAACSNTLAFVGVDLYKRHEQGVEKMGKNIVYDRDNEEQMNWHRRFFGMMQEIDAALILLGVARRHPEITVVPAPHQFEDAHAQKNVDFVAHDIKRRTAIGIQIKTHAHEKQVEHSDHDRVVFVDGVTDLGNIRVARINNKSSRERVVPWPGIIAIKRFELAKGHGAVSSHMGQFSTAVVVYKMLAKRLAGNLRIDYNDVTQKVEDRIMDKLAA